MLCGLPVITLSTPTKDNSQLEVVGHDRGGLVVANVGSMVWAMGSLSRDPALRNQYADVGAAWVRREYGQAKVASTLIRIIGHIRSCANREALHEALRTDQYLVTTVASSDVRALISRSIGAPRLHELLVMRVVHIPWVYRAWLGCRSFRARKAACV